MAVRDSSRLIPRAKARVLSACLWKVQFLLYKDGDFSSAYRELHLFVTVTEPHVPGDPLAGWRA